MKYKKTFLCLQLLFTTLFLHSQTVISGSIGVDWTDMEHPQWVEDAEFQAHVYLKPNAENSSVIRNLSKKSSVVSNLSLDLYIFPKFSLGFNSNLTRKIKDAEYLAPGLIIQRLSFLYFRGSVVAKYHPYSFLYVGVGFNQNYTFRSRLYSGRISDLHESDPLEGTSKGNGVDFLVGTKYNNLFFEVKSSRGLEDDRIINYFAATKKLNSFSASLGYRVDISKKKKRE